ncbi:MAG: flippase [Candidatus Omnitrophota bacterium]|jgi:O-antigen/teichoic acid export membrane protein
MTKTVELDMPVVTRSLLTKNSILNVSSQFIPLLVTFFTVPYIVAHLGMERFGIFAIVRVMIDYFTIFDLGLGVATTRFIANSLGNKDNLNISRIYWTLILLVTCLGVIAASLFYLFVPVLSARVFIISSNLLPEIIAVSMIASPLILFLLVKSVLTGTVQAYQRFDLFNMVNVPNLIFSAIVPVFVLMRGGGLKEIIIWLVLVEFVFLLIWYIVSLSIIPYRKFQGLLRPALLKEVVSYGSWLLVQRISNWILCNVHTVILGILVSVSAIGYYSIPYTLASKIGLIGAGIMPVIFPAASLFDGKDIEKSRRLFHGSLKYIILLYGLACLILFVFAKEILILWVGDAFIKSVFVTQLLAVSVFLNGISWIFIIFTQVNNPRFVSIVSFVQTFCYLLLLWFLTKSFGFVGAGYAWFFLSLSTIVIFGLYSIKSKCMPKLLNIDMRFTYAAGYLTAILLLNNIIKHFNGVNVPGVILNMMLLVSGYTVIAWVFFVDSEQKDAISLIVRKSLAVKR